MAHFTFSVVVVQVINIFAS